VLLQQARHRHRLPPLSPPDPARNKSNRPGPACFPNPARPGPARTGPGRPGRSAQAMGPAAPWHSARPGRHRRRRCGLLVAGGPWRAGRGPAAAGPAARIRAAAAGSEGGRPAAVAREEGRGGRFCTDSRFGPAARRMSPSRRVPGTDSDFCSQAPPGSLRSLAHPGLLAPTLRVARSIRVRLGVPNRANGGAPRRPGPSAQLTGTQAGSRFRPSPTPEAGHGSHAGNGSHVFQVAGVYHAAASGTRTRTARASSLLL
jgi:hypothetical protein